MVLVATNCIEWIYRHWLAGVYFYSFKHIIHIKLMLVNQYSMKGNSWLKYVSDKKKRVLDAISMDTKASIDCGCLKVYINEQKCGFVCDLGTQCW